MFRSLALAALLTALAAVDLELSLSSGRTVRGELVSENDQQVVMRTRHPVRGGMKVLESTHLKADILKRREIPSAAEQYDKRKAATPDTVPELCALAQWSYENCLREPARVHALRVLELEPDNAWARRILDNCGYIEVEAKWVDEAEYMKQNNLARVDGKLVKAEIADARKALARAVDRRDNLAKRLKELRDITGNRPQALAKAEADYKKANAELEKAEKDAAAGHAKLGELQREPAKTKKEQEDLRKRMAEVRADIDDAQKRKTAAAQAKSDADRRRKSDGNSVEKAKAELPKLEAEWQKACDEVKAAAAKLGPDDSAAKAALAAAPEAKPAPAPEPEPKAKPVEPAVEAPPEP